MNDSTNNSSPDDGEESGELVWNEFDWERYLRQRDQAVREYRDSYEKAFDSTDRLDEVARELGWEPTLDGDLDSEEDEDEFDDDLDPYTLHRNPVFVATRAIFAGLVDSIEAAASTGNALVPADAFPLLRLLNAAEMAVVLGVQSLDLGDNTLGISQLKRALSLLNAAMGRLPGATEDGAEGNPLHRAALPRLFDLREICLRVIREGRMEEQGPSDSSEPF